MAADVTIKALVDDTAITTASPYTILVGQSLYRGMVVFEESHEVYTKNASAGSTNLSNPTWGLDQVSGCIGEYMNGKLTGSAKDDFTDNVTTAAVPGLSNDVDTIYIDYDASPYKTSIVQTAIPDLGSPPVMKSGRAYDLWAKFRSTAGAELGTSRWRHTMGGTD